jgi:pyruvate formate lyase activating enzyme
MIYPEKCIDCRKCIAVCESGASFIESGVVCYDRALCTACRRCAEACPAEARKMVGEVVDVDHVMKEVEKDYLFYVRSHGGVTFGGGEATLYPAFVDAVASICKSKGIHTAIETCGYAKWEVLERATRQIDLVLYDIKHMDSDAHAALCGHGNERILTNLTRLGRLGRSDVIVRIPILPGLNDDEVNIDRTARFISSLGDAVTRVDLLAYHRFALGKYQRLEREYQPKEMDVPDDARMSAIKEAMQSYGLIVQA